MREDEIGAAQCIKPIYWATNFYKAEHALNHLEQKRGGRYPQMIASWRRNRTNLAMLWFLSSAEGQLLTAGAQRRLGKGP